MRNRHIVKLRNMTSQWAINPLVPVVFVYRILKALSKFTFNVIYLLPALILRILNFRFLPFFTFRIGHLMLEPDGFIKEMQLGLVPQCRPIVLAPKGAVANHAAISYWKRYYTVVESPIAVALLRPFSWHPLTTINTTRYAYDVDGTVAYPKIQAQWAGRPPLLEINGNDKRRGEDYLKKIGLPSGAWFVCIHSREGGYTHSPNDEDLGGYRNSRIETYFDAVDYVISQGGYCIRMGDPTMVPIKERPGLIDYVHHPERSDWLDLYLCANCRLFLGNTSGAFFMSSVFGVPVACANMVPLSGIYPYGPNDIAIPKLYREASTGRLLTFKEILDQPIGNFFTSHEFRRHGLELVDNTPDEIRDLLVEQLRRVTEPSFSYTEEEEQFQRRFSSLFRPGHYSYGSASRVGTAFLRKYSDLLP
jgi:putative glycosyltransferase (TIGR04372 family)